MAKLILPKDAMPWVGFYVFVASLVCTLAMAADVFEGFRKRKLWFPCKFFTINAASLTLIAVAMKLPVDLNTDMSASKSISIIFLVAMLGNFSPSLGLMDDKELLTNMIALGILIITVTVNVWLQYSTAGSSLIIMLPMFTLICSLPCPFSVALIVPESRKLLQHRYKELQRLDSLNQQEINFSCDGLVRYVKKYWMMAETGNPQFAVACSPISSAYGVISLCSVCILVQFVLFNDGYTSISEITSSDNPEPRVSEYKWSISLICISQSVGAIIGSIAPIFRCLSATIHFILSKEWSVSHLNVFIVEKYWTQRLQVWKRSHVRSGIPGRNGKKVFNFIKNMILNFCIGLQITVVVICKTMRVIPRSFLILCSWCFYFFISLLKKCKEPNASDSNVFSGMEEYTSYVLQNEAEGQLSKRILRNSFNSITRLLQESEKKEPRNLLKLLNKSTGFCGVIEFDNDEVPPLQPEEIQNCWSLVAVTLTTIALSLPNIANDHVKGLLAGMSEGVKFVRHIEESLNTNDELVKARKTAGYVWTEVEVYCRWLQIDYQKKARQGEMAGKILQWLGDEAVEIVKDYLMTSKNENPDYSLPNFIAASTMYRCSRTILHHCNEQENWPTNEELFDYISTMIADLLCACFTNLPRVIILKCHADAIEKREDSIRTTAQLLGKSKKILKILEALILPNLDLDSMAYIDNWHALPESQIPNGCSSSAKSQPASSGSSESTEVTT